MSSNALKNVNWSQLLRIHVKTLVKLPEAAMTFRDMHFEVISDITVVDHNNKFLEAIKDMRTFIPRLLGRAGDTKPASNDSSVAPKVKTQLDNIKAEPYPFSAARWLPEPVLKDIGTPSKDLTYAEALRLMLKNQKQNSSISYDLKLPGFTEMTLMPCDELLSKFVGHLTQGTSATEQLLALGKEMTGHNLKAASSLHQLLADKPPMQVLIEQVALTPARAGSPQTVILFLQQHDWDADFGPNSYRLMIPLVVLHGKVYAGVAVPEQPRHGGPAADMLRKVMVLLTHLESDRLGNLRTEQSTRGFNLFAAIGKNASAIVPQEVRITKDSTRIPRGMYAVWRNNAGLKDLLDATLGSDHRSAGVKKRGQKEGLAKYLHVQRKELDKDGLDVSSPSEGVSEVKAKHDDDKNDNKPT